MKKQKEEAKAYIQEVSRRVSRMKMLMRNGIDLTSAIERELVQSEVLLNAEVAALASATATYRLILTALEATYGEPTLTRPALRFDIT